MMIMIIMMMLESSGANCDVTSVQFAKSLDELFARRDRS